MLIEAYIVYSHGWLYALIQSLVIIFLDLALYPEDDDKDESTCQPKGSSVQKGIRTFRSLERKFPLRN